MEGNFEILNRQAADLSWKKRRTPAPESVVPLRQKASYPCARNRRTPAPESAVDENFTSVDEKFTSVDETFTSVDKKFPSAPCEFDQLIS